MAHDTMDRFVAAVAGIFDRLFHRPAADPETVAFTDEWEREQIYRELHQN
jgi:hypothetical protein